MSKQIVWHQVLDNKNELAENRVITVTAGHKDLCLTHWKGAAHNVETAPS